METGLTSFSDFGAPDGSNEELDDVLMLGILNAAPILSFGGL